VLVVVTKQGAELLERLASNHIQELLKWEPLLADSLKRLRDIRR
jgi:hypothetical protein